MVKSMIVNACVSAFVATTCVYYLSRMSESDNMPRIQKNALPPTHDQSVFGHSDVVELKNTIKTLEKNQSRLEALIRQNQRDIESTAILAIESDHKNVENPPLSREPLDRELLDRQEQTQESELNNVIAGIEHEMALQTQESSWSSEMNTQLSDVALRLEAFNNGATSIADQDCRASACRVVFSHQDQSVDVSMLPMLIASSGSTNVVLKHISENGEHKTIAYYRP